MQEKLLQAAIITFLLYLIAGLSPNTKVQTKAATSLPEMQTPIASSLLPTLR
ncbi:MAG: hypothetical protein HEQ35_25225 [Gloeotrichia echinulata IR180]|jgi:hypothetical protein|nr:hypothetical protein [Gloeotrichia echinulata DEX184]